MRRHQRGFPAKISDKLTVDQLLTHTSGLGDAALRLEPTGGAGTTTDELLRKITKEPLQFEPGSRFGYSNDGFIVLGAIIERITGQHYRDYLREHIFEVASMIDTDMAVYQPRDVANMAHGYMRN